MPCLFHPQYPVIAKHGITAYCKACLLPIKPLQTMILLLKGFISNNAVKKNITVLIKQPQ